MNTTDSPSGPLEPTVSLHRREVGFTSMGRDPNVQATCCWPQCQWLKNGPMDGGWCTHPTNRVPPSGSWTTGFTPSVASTGGCSLHSDMRANAALSGPHEGD